MNTVQSLACDSKSKHNWVMQQDIDPKSRKMFCAERCLKLKTKMKIFDWPRRSLRPPVRKAQGEDLKPSFSLQGEHGNSCPQLEHWMQKSAAWFYL